MFLKLKVCKRYIVLFSKAIAHTAASHLRNQGLNTIIDLGLSESSDHCGEKPASSVLDPNGLC